MNRVYKVIWSKVKSCYIVVSELAKNHTKASKSGVVNRALVAGVLACIIGSGFVFPLQTEAAYTYSTIFTSGQTSGRHSVSGTASADGFLMITAESADDDVHVKVNGTYVAGEILGQYVIVPISKGASYEIYDSYNESSTFNDTVVRFATGGGGVLYTAGNGITISNDTISVKATNGIVVNGNGIGVKAGTGITVDGNGVSITSGSVASGNANAITGGTAYTELRPVNGTFVKSNQTTAANLTALDTASKNAIKGLSANGSVITYTKGDGTTGTISTSAKYVGVNSSNGTNQTGEGAVAADSITVGKNAKAIKNNSVALGLDSYADEANTISVGHSKTKLDTNGVPIDPDTNQPYVNPSSVTIFDTALTRKITNVANGVNQYDAVNFGQLIGIQGGSVVSGNTKLVSGGTAFTELRPADGQFIRRTNTTAQNLTALDNMGKSAVKSMTVDGNMLVYTRGDNTSVSLDLPTGGGGGSTSGINRFTGEGVTTTVGSVTAFASNSTPTGYLLCDGRAVSRTKYANLFKKIGTTYGAGDGKTTFNLPNLVNRFVEGSTSSGQYIQAGLPNITGRVGAIGEEDTDWTSGAFYQDNVLIPGDDWGIDYSVYMDASRSSPIYGRSDTVQPESLKMQYYIKTDDEYNGSRYVGVNSASGALNEFGEGAVGVDSVAIGKNTSASTSSGVAVGPGATVKGANSVAVGNSSYAGSHDEVSFGHKAGDPTYQSGQTYSTALTRRLTNVTDGYTDTDAATYGQMQRADTALSDRIGTVTNNGYYIKNSSVNNVSQNLQAVDSQLKNLSDSKADIGLNNINDEGINVIQTLSKGSVNVVGADKAVVTKTDVEGVDTYTVSVKANGIIADGNNDIVSGDTVYDALQSATGNLKDYTDTELAKKANADASNIGRNREFDNSAEWGRAIGTGTVSAYDGQLVTGNTVYNELRPAEDGTYINNVNTTAENLMSLDSHLAEVAEQAQHAVGYDDETHSKVTLSGDGGTIITNVADGELALNSTDAVNGGQLYQTNQDINFLREEYNRLRNEYNETEQNSQTGFDVNINGRKVKTVNPDSNTVDFASGDHVRLSNDNGTVKISVSDDGKVAEGNTDLVTGGTVYRAIEALDIQNKMDAKADTDLSNLTEDGKDTIRDLAKGSVSVIGKDEIKVEKTTEHDTDVYTVRVEASGQVAEGNTGLVTGDTVYNSFQEIKNVYANKDASNVDAQVWGEKLGNGTVDNSDGKLVSGKTVAGETRVTADGNYIQQANTAAQNLNELDRVLKETRDLAETSALTGTDAFAVHYSDVDKSTVSLQGENGTLITNLKDGELSADSKDAVTGKQLFETNEKVKTNTEDIRSIYDKLGTVEDGAYVSADKTFGENIGALDTQLKTVSDGLDEMRVDVNNLRDTMTETANGKADTDLSNLTDDGKTVISDIAKNSVKVKGSGLATVTSSEEGQTTVYTVDVQADGIVEEGNAGAVSGGTVYNTIQDIRDEMTVGLDTKADTDLSNLTDRGKETIRETVKSDLDSKADKSDLDGKANVDASNIDFRAWAVKLGTGKIAPGDIGLINGDTAYRAVEYLRDNGVVKADFDNGVIGIANDSRYDSIDLIDVSKSDGSTRVMTGVATDPKDPTSVSNVAYVNAMGQLVMDNMNNGLARMDDKIGKVGASAAAMAALETPPMDGDEKWAFAATVGHYDGKTAGAVGAYYRPQDNVLVNVRGAVGNGEDMIGAGIGISLNRGNTPYVSKAQMVRTINAQADRINLQTNQLNAQAQKIQSMETVQQQSIAKIAQLESALKQVLAAQQKVNG